MAKAESCVSDPIPDSCCEVVAHPEMSRVVKAVNLLKF